MSRYPGSTAEETAPRKGMAVRKLVDAQDFCFVIGHPRSGTTVFEGMLQTHPIIFGMGEIFNESNPRSYFHFEQGLLRDDPRAGFPSRRLGNFLKYLEHCRGLARERPQQARIIVLDIKYDQAHLLCEPWWSIAALPRTFSLLRELGCRIIDVHRDDLIGMVISNQIAIQTKVYHSNKPGIANIVDTKAQINPERLLRQITATSKVYERIHRYFNDYGNYLMVTYEEMFDGERFSAPLLDRITTFLDVKQEFDPVPKLAKVLSNDVLSHVENAAELRTFLKEAHVSGVLPAPFRG